MAYLRDLGVDWVYLSPLLAAEPGSAHGYDVVAHDRVDESRGGAAGLAALSAEARRLGLGVLVDIVPNHVGVATPAACAWWWDLLRLGRSSRYAGYFDVDWAAGGGRIRIPVVGDEDLGTHGRVAHLHVQDDALCYHDQRFPLAPGSAEPADDPDAVHARQHYELVGWRTADTDLNYRRFFAVNTLAAIRVEDTQVFLDSHAEIQRWFADGLVDGLRVDHPDGLRDPGTYLADLAALTGGAYVVVEKILEPGEELPRGWATTGTTGYDALAWIDRVLTDPAGEQALTDLETQARGAPVDVAQLTHDTKRQVADGILNSEVHRVTRELVAQLARSSTPPAHDRVADAVAELLACFPVYRSYLPHGAEHLRCALERASQHRPDLVACLEVLAPVLGDPATDAALRFQQTSGMVMAKGVEDCAFYRTSRLTSLNEVGGDPGLFAISPADFHHRVLARHQRWPYAMTSLSTHDTKRGEDVRARITALAEMPEAWAEALQQLLRLAPLPDAGFGALLWQAVLGTWPADRERLHGYAEKAMREAGDHTTWTAPDVGYESAVHRAVDAAFDDPAVVAVLNRVLELVAAPGWSNALAAKLIALTMPGVPDVYQGSELWEQSLVDPDNRRFVDLDARTELLARLHTGMPVSLSDRPDDTGVAKLWVTHTALTWRRDRPDLFTGYRPLTAAGAAADHLLGFDRGGALSLVTRLPIGLADRGGWGDTIVHLPPGRWRNVLARGSAPVAESGPGNGVRVADVLSGLPVALLVAAEEQETEPCASAADRSTSGRPVRASSG